MNYDKLIVFGAALEAQVKAATGLVQELFRKPVKEWLMDKPADERRTGVIVGGMVKAFIQETRPKDALATERVEEDFNKLTDKGKFSPAEILSLIANGTLGVSNHAELAKVVAAKLNKPVEGYTIRIPGGDNPALKFLTQDEGKFVGLATALRKTVDIEGLIAHAANDPMSPEAEDIVRRGQVALQKTK